MTSQVGAVLLVGFSSVAFAGPDDGNHVLKAASRCSDFGPGYVDVGNGTCGRTSTHVRVGGQNASANAWTTQGTSNAGLRSDSGGMIPGSADSTHLRVRSGLDPLSLFR